MILVVVLSRRRVIHWRGLHPGERSIPRMFCVRTGLVADVLERVAIVQMKRRIIRLRQHGIPEVPHSSSPIAFARSDAT